MTASRRQLLSGLLFECPFHNANPPDCPLHEQRQQDLEARTEWLDSLPDDEVERLVVRHALCLAHKEQG